MTRDATPADPGALYLPFAEVAMDTVAILAKIGLDAPQPMTVDLRECGPWFRMMARETGYSDQQLANRDIGSLNLEAALGLPGTERLNLDACVQKLNSWAKQLRAYTEEHWPRFVNSPKKYGGTPARFRMLALVTFLQKHLGVRYNMAFSQGDYNATDARDMFIHGMLSGHGGTCGTMPVLYIAVGRRLGYPLYLVRAKEHSFARWEERGGERFNIECTSPGFRALNDEHYRHLPKPLSRAELESGMFLRNLRPREVLAQFLCDRAHCLMDNLRAGEAVMACFLAAQLAPKCEIVHGDWAVATVMARAMEAARVKSGLADYSVLNLPRVPVPDGEQRFEKWAAAIVRRDLQRLARLRKAARKHARYELERAKKPRDKDINL
jgi:hypothetical protein